MAVEVSTKQMALTRDTGYGGFMERAQAMLAFSCSTVLSEPGATPYHEKRAAYAQQVTRNPLDATRVAGPHIVMGVNVVGTTTYDEATKTSTCSIADIDLQSQILTLWNALAGLDTQAEIMTRQGAAIAAGVLGVGVLFAGLLAALGWILWSGYGTW